MWLLWLFKISSWYCSTVHAFVCLLNTVWSWIRSILSMVHSFSLTAIVYCDDITSYHTVWCFLSTKMIIESKAQSLMLIAFTTVTHSWFSDCVTNAFSALYDSVITLTVFMTLIWNPVLSNCRCLCLRCHILPVCSSQAEISYSWLSWVELILRSYGLVAY